MTKTARLIRADIKALNAIPEERRREDWRIAKGLLLEAAGYDVAGHDLGAKTMREAAAPYLRFAELVR